jgi:hypothetical protein
MNRLRGSCDGLFIVCQRSPRFGSRFYIYNPIIRKHARLQQPQVGQTFYNAIIGFYRYHPTGEYRVLWISRSHHSWSHHLCKPTLCVLTVGSDQPRYIRLRMPTVLSPSLKQKLLKWLNWSSYYSPPVHHRGSLHWCPYGAGGIRNIMVFDTEAESFRWMQSPTQLWPNKLLPPDRFR